MKGRKAVIIRYLAVIAVFLVFAGVLVAFFSSREPMLICIRSSLHRLIFSSVFHVWNMKFLKNDAGYGQSLAAMPEESPCSHGLR